MKKPGKAVFVRTGIQKKCRRVAEPKLIALAVVGLFTTTGLYASEFCDSLDAAIEAAPSQFAKFKAGRDEYYDPDSPSFLTTWRVDDASGDNCRMFYDSDDGYSLDCTWWVSSSSAAKSKAEQLSASVSACFAGKEFLAESWREGQFASSYGATNNRIRKFLAPTNSSFDVEITVNASCTTRKGTGEERCHASIEVDLIGDEK